ncbi:MAG: hypothetical protein WCA85_25890 [Paraburkholderia sp.]|uniref:hypothetical protein n=1 Tax=Paraburkholderia sp. TaxID=1926495 RepID=UPI003C686BE3
MNNSQPIHIDPLLGEVSELLHRMELCQEDTPATRMAGEALRKLKQYEAKISNARVTQ